MSTWNDDRLDELSRRTDAGFAEMRQGFARVDQKFERLYHILLGLIGSILAATLTGIVALIVAL